MEITMLELITKYGMDTLIIAFLIFVLTGLVKQPVKRLSGKLKDGSKLTRFITFLPILIGFGMTVLYELVFKKKLVFDGNFFTLWLTSSSLSLAIYAFKEKFLPGRNKILSEQEIRENEELIDRIKDVLETKPAGDVEEQAGDIKESECNASKSAQANKIILRGNGNGESVTSEKE